MDRHFLPYWPAKCAWTSHNLARTPGEESKGLSSNVRSKSPMTYTGSECYDASRHAASWSRSRILSLSGCIQNPSANNHHFIRSSPCALRSLTCPLICRKPASPETRRAPRALRTMPSERRPAPKFRCSRAGNTAAPDFTRAAYVPKDGGRERA